MALKLTPVPLSDIRQWPYTIQEWLRQLQAYLAGSTGVPGEAGQVLTSTGTGSAPTYQPAMIKNSVGSTESITIPSGFQLIVVDDFTITGTLIATGTLGIL